VDIVWTAGIAAGLLLLGLAAERRRLERFRKKVPLRVCVAGTRGKSTVARLVASILRESGRRVLAKTTGSKPVLILPDGEEREIVRLGPPSVLEQKRVLALAAGLGAEAVVAEMMSIRPEYLAVESERIFAPGLLLITNVRLDHVEEMGDGKAGIAESLAAAISRGATVLVPEEESFPVFENRARARRAVLRPVPGSDDQALFPENVRLAMAVAKALGVDEATARRGIARAKPDFGGLAVFCLPSPLSGKTWRFVNAFAANEPESSARILAALESRFPFEPEGRIALFALRSDRADRTKQWLEAFRDGFFAGFSSLVFIGEGAPAAARACRRRRGAEVEVMAVGSRNPESIMGRLWPLAAGEAQVVGLGNIVGLGAALVETWSAMAGRPE